MIGPKNGVPQYLEVVFAEHLPEGTVNVERKVGDAPHLLPEVKARDIRLGRARIHLLHGQVRVTGYERERHLSKRLPRSYLNPGNAVDDAWRVFKAGRSEERRVGKEG